MFPAFAVLEQMMQHQPIPIEAAREIAERYGYEQVVIYARKTGENGGEHMTTYGTVEPHKSIAADMGRVLRKFMGWDLP